VHLLACIDQHRHQQHHEVARHHQRHTIGGTRRHWLDAHLHPGGSCVPARSTNGATFRPLSSGAPLLAPCDPLKALLVSFANIFVDPRGLPLPRWHHRIRLLLGLALVVVRPYCYPQLFKDETEKQCDDMLQQGIIRECTSTFSWRFCIDYHKLNEKTIKDKFLIPVVDELLDELRGLFLTKLDLHSGYHQVCMHLNNINNKGFMTHQGH
jgi:hypothetical protein